MSMTWEELNTRQPIVVKMLTNSLRKNRVAHAYLFEGEKGTGKKEFAIFLAKSLFCQQAVGINPCLTCSNCKRIASGNHPDVHIIEPDGLSIKKQQIQHLQEEFSKTGVESKHKYYIINQADKMTPNASNSLLKFLEEPNEFTTAILLTEQNNQMLDTILSRCQTLSFKPMPKQILISQLIEEGISPDTANVVVQLTNSKEEAIQLSQDDWFAEARKVVLQLCEVLDSKTQHGIIFIQEKWLPHFHDREQTERGLDLFMIFYRDILSVLIGEEEQVILRDQQQLLKKIALQVSQKQLIQRMNAILEAKRRLSANVQSQLLMEQLVLNLQEGS
ncbi:DNA polymerase III subunit delta' [Bacillus sp. BGMRC 2118]|nr:DNA polymerase III subunit delta' [Bacillus sp. BGMRC 2118]